MRFEDRDDGRGEIRHPTGNESDLVILELTGSEDGE